MGLEEDDVKYVQTIVREARGNFKRNKQQRGSMKWRCRRLNWEEHLEMLCHTNSFQSRYHMSDSSFSRPSQNSGRSFWSFNMMRSSRGYQRSGWWSSQSSSFQILDGFLGAIDRWLCCTNKPSGQNNSCGLYDGK
eukprot:scaffold301500_cov59-Attheya_sp.AAC.1